MKCPYHEQIISELSRIRMLQNFMLNLLEDMSENSSLSKECFPPSERFPEKYKNELLSNKIRLADIPIVIRIRHASSYIIACRISRNVSKERYLEDLKVLENDLKAPQKKGSHVNGILLLELTEQMHYVEENHKNSMPK